MLKRSDEKGPISKKINLKIIGPDDKSILHQELPIEMTESHRRTRIRSNFTLPIEQSGEYKFIVDCPGDTRLNKELSIVVNLIRKISGPSH